MPAFLPTESIYDESGNLLRTYPLPYFNLAGIAVPGATDDETKGYNIGSMLVIRGSAVYFCFDNTRGAAQWLQAGAGGGGGAPANAQYLTGASDALLTAERVVTDTSTISWDLTTAGQAKANVIPGTFVAAGDPAGGDLAGTYPNPSVAKASAAFALTGDISPSVSTDQNDWNPTGLSSASVIRVNATADMGITGIAGGADGRVLTILSVGSANVSLVNESVASTAANRIKTGLSGNLMLPNGTGAIVVYDSTSSRWRLVSRVGISTGEVTYGKLQQASGTPMVLGASGSAVIGEIQTTGDNLVLCGNLASGPLWSNVTEAHQILSDVTTLNVSTSAHGYAPKAPNDTTKFLRGDATWATLGVGTAPVYNSDTGTGLVGFSSDTYIAESMVVVPAGGFIAKSRYRVRLRLSKTGAGTGQITINIRFGTNGSTADTSIATITFAAQTAVADDGVIEVSAHMNSLSTTATVNPLGEIRHRLTTTGLTNAGANASVIGSASSFNNVSAGGKKLGISLNGGASASFTIGLIEAELVNLA